ISQSGVGESQLSAVAKVLQGSVPGSAASKSGQCEPESCGEESVSALLMCLGDFLAQLASVNVGQRRLLELLALMGTDAFLLSVQSLNLYAEKFTLEMLANMPQGSSEFQDVMEGEDGSGGVHL